MMPLFIMQRLCIAALLLVSSLAHGDEDAAEKRSIRGNFRNLARATYTPTNVKASYYEVGPIETLPVNFNDVFLPYKEEWVSEINFPSTDGEFAGSGRSHNVVAVFEGLLKFPSAGTWTLFVSSIDGSKLYVDNGLVVNNNGLHKVMVAKKGTVEVDSSSLVKSFRLEYFKGAEGNNGLRLRWKGPGYAKSDVRAWNFDAITSFVGLPMFAYMIPNVTVSYYAWETRDALPNFTSLVPDSTSDGYFYSWPNEGCSDTENNAVVLEGNLQFPSAGSWKIFVTSDDDLRMYADGQLVLTVNGNIGVRDKGKAVVDVASGSTIQKIRIEYLELCRGSGIDLQWAGPGISKTYIPNEAWVVI